MGATVGVVAERLVLAFAAATQRHMCLFGDHAMVVGVDGTADSLAALLGAAELGEEAGAELVVVHFRRESWLASAVLEVSAEPAMNESLDIVDQMARESFADVLAGRRVRWQFEVASGDPATALIAAAREHQASAVVVGGRSHGIVGGLVAGSVAQKLVRRSPLSVLVVRNGRAHQVEMTCSGHPT
jgi:nucleotide-binding universal stress UspA family protein